MRSVILTLFLLFATSCGDADGEVTGANVTEVAPNGTVTHSASLDKRNEKDVSGTVKVILNTSTGVNTVRIESLSFGTDTYKTSLRVIAYSDTKPLLTQGLKGSSGNQNYIVDSVKGEQTWTSVTIQNGNTVYAEALFSN